jgi:thiosulfate dehydrogenase
VKRNTFAAGFLAICVASAVATFAQRGPGSMDRPQDVGLSGYGRELVTQTYAEIGPEVPDLHRRFAGNNLACQSCHLDAGTNPHALPLTDAYKGYPRFSQRDGQVISLVDRINECMTRSMNGRPLPDDSREMAALLAYFRSIGNAPASDVHAAAPASLRGDPIRGAEVYARVCAACHQADGLGKRRGGSSDAGGYEFPPLWGPDSFNAGAGMNEDRNFLRFVRGIMPRGIDPDRPQLSWQEVSDVAAYVRSKPRPALK